MVTLFLDYFADTRLSRPSKPAKHSFLGDMIVRCREPMRMLRIKWQVDPGAMASLSASFLRYLYSDCEQGA